MKERHACIIALAVLLFSVQSLAFAQIFTDNTTKQAIIENNESIAKLTAIVRDLNKKNSNLAKQLAVLTQKLQKSEQKLRTLSGDIEIVENKTESILKNYVNQKEFDQAFSKIVALEENFHLKNEKLLYETAIDYYNKQEMQNAVNAFNSLLEKYPDSQLKGDVLLALSQSYFHEKDYASTLEYTDKIINLFGDDQKLAPKAYLINAKALLGINNSAEGYKKLGQLLSLYPSSAAAKEARTILQ